MTTTTDFLAEVTSRLERLSTGDSWASIDAAAALVADAVIAGGVVHAYGTGHSQGFVMEIAGRAGGLIPTNAIALRDVVLHGQRDKASLEVGSKLERDPEIVDELWSVTPVDPRDIFLIASNSGVNGSIVGMALRVKEAGHRLIAVTSLEHTNAVEPKHPSGKRLSELADVVIDNLAPYGDSTMTVAGAYGVGAVSSITASYIAQLITIDVTERIAATGTTPPLYISANVPGGDEHNHALEDRYRGRIRRTA